MSDPAIDLRFGRWQDALAEVTCDALIVDAPYSERTHSAHDAAVAEAARFKDYLQRTPDPTGGTGPRRMIAYDRWSAEDVATFCGSWSGRVRGWFVTLTDHVLAREWERVLTDLGRYVFAPVPLVETGSRVRLLGDGPSSWTCWVVVARPRTKEFARWGTLPGAYIAATERKAVVGGKPMGLMRAIVRDYSRPGDLICDPCAGGGTTLLAARLEGRRAIGAEMMREHYQIAASRLARSYTPLLPGLNTNDVAPEQLDLISENDAS